MSGDNESELRSDNDGIWGDPIKIGLTLGSLNWDSTQKKLVGGGGWSEVEVPGVRWPVTGKVQRSLDAGRFGWMGVVLGELGRFRNTLLRGPFANLVNLKPSIEGSAPGFEVVVDTSVKEVPNKKAFDAAYDLSTRTQTPGHTNTSLLRYFTDASGRIMVEKRLTGNYEAGDSGVVSVRAWPSDYSEAQRLRLKMPEPRVAVPGEFGQTLRILQQQSTSAKSWC